MKKICLLLVTTILLMSTSVACATTSFDFKYTRDDTSEKKALPAERAPADNKTIYLRCFCSDSDYEYTHHFRVHEMRSATANVSTPRESKWVTCGLTVPVLSKGTKKDMYYTVSSRINTNYFLDNDVDEVHLTGQFWFN